ncbi:MAG: xanthine dehydrogenase family protein subunit M [Armatimonadota bacterium]|nr:xanthine dehydrogenase family protein subunit M [Armatimonadota bacterium]MDR7561055.1 xanthine dehydrogenase family protein subunit M [Armatimonadota bacterium]MDR7582761.1 xanthine dehydrogenase family protein subunit M [Armatimonadota bacterium]MDR7613084.1 xanthine dehydrogenase family protein subunit M [Armatimonadota bacterium]
MKPPPFRYAAPASVDQVVSLLAAHGPEAKLLAGGQSLMPLLNLRLARPAVLVDLNRVRELDYIREEDGQVIIGAMTRQRTAERSPVVRRRLPLLADALPLIGHPPIRSRGTVGGSIAHADPSAELPAVLVALDGSVAVRGPGGTRTVPAAEFFVSYLTTVLGPEDLLVEVRLPAHGDAGTAFLEVARRHGDFALVGVAVLARVSENRCRGVRLAFTGVGPTPVRVPEAEEAAEGRELTAAVCAEVRTAVEARLQPDSDIHASAAYRREVAGVLAERALRLAVQRAREVE